MNSTPAHYDKGFITPFDVIEDWGLGFHEGNIIKYLCRWREKDGLNDLVKARAYLDRLIMEENRKVDRVEEGS